MMAGRGDGEHERWLKGERKKKDHYSVFEYPWESGQNRES